MKKVLLSFDVEEFDLPREHGANISLDESLKVSADGLVRILEVLDKAKVKATFFITGNFAEGKPELVQQIKKGGHEIACHGVDHFKPAKTDIYKSKEIVERVAGVKVVGYRQPRMFKISYKELKRCGYKYDSSVNPAFIPGRYNHLDTPRDLFIKEEIVEVPTSVAGFMRVPLFWLALHLMPFGVYVKFAKMSIKKTGYFATYFHPWEFAEALKEYKIVPVYIKQNSGKKLAVRLERLIMVLMQNGCEFVTYDEYVSEWYNKNVRERGKDEKTKRKN